MLILKNVVVIGIAGSGKPILVATTGMSARLMLVDIFTYKTRNKTKN